jgi:hypothetical protein
MPLPRRDSYGAPLPALSDARREVLYQKAFNALQRRRVLALLEEQYQALLRRDVDADVSVSFHVREGMLQAEVRVQVVRQYRFTKDEAL